MLIVALVLAVIGLAALVTAVVTSNELVAWVCIGASVLGVILLIVDAIRERQSRDLLSADTEAGEIDAAHTVDETYQNYDEEYEDDLQQGEDDLQQVEDDALEGLESDVGAGPEPVTEVRYDTEQRED